MSILWALLEHEKWKIYCVGFDAADTDTKNQIGQKQVSFLSKGRFPLRKISLGSDRIGLDSFPSCNIHTARPKKLKVL